MAEQIPEGMRVCKYCGKLTSTKANFCYYCARELDPRPEHPLEEPKPVRINWVVVGILLAIILVLIAVFALR